MSTIIFFMYISGLVTKIFNEFSRDWKSFFKCFFLVRMVSCLLKHFIRKIKSNAVRRFDVSNIIIKNEEKVDVVAKKS